MFNRITRTLLLSVPVLLTPLLANGQSDPTYSVGSAQLCSLDDAGQVSCIVAAGFERLRAPDNLPALSAVTAGDTHACGISLDGQPVCWGDNLFGQLNAPTVDLPLVQIDAGANHTCALNTLGEAICWGLNINLQLEPPEGASFTQIDAAGIASCGLLESGGFTCFTNDPGRSPQDLAGPFVKFDLRGGIACGLTTDGRIECNEPSTLTPPNNGPYTDLATTFAAICGLGVNGELDCTFREPDVDNEYPLGEQFLSIQSDATDVGTTVFSLDRFTLFGTTMCGKRLDGSIQCWDEGGNFPDLEGANTTTADVVASMEFDLDARIYAVNRVEIFWTPLANNTSAGPDPAVEIFRNGELIRQVNARFSFFDSNALLDANYQIRLVDDAGNVGALSEVLSVNTIEGTVLFNGEPPLMESRLEDTQDVDLFTDIKAVTLFPGLVVSWEVAPELLDTIDGYEIRVNGASVGFTRSQLFVETTTSPSGRCIQVIAIGLDGSRIGSRSIGNACI